MIGFNADHAVIYRQIKVFSQPELVLLRILFPFWKIMGKGAGRDPKGSQTYVPEPALLVGIVIAFTALIPIFGAFVGCAVGAFLIFMVDPVKALIFVALFLVLQQIEGNFIYPHVVRNSVGLPSIWVLAAVSLGGNLMGIVGMLIFIPIVSVVYALFREVVYLKLKQKGIKPEEIE